MKTNGNKEKIIFIAIIKDEKKDKESLQGRNDFYSCIFLKTGKNRRVNVLFFIILTTQICLYVKFWEALKNILKFSILLKSKN